MGLSSTSTKQLERMIGDAAILTYPLHLLAGLIRTFLYTLLFIGLLIFILFLWMFTAHEGFLRPRIDLRVGPMGVVERDGIANRCSGLGSISSPTFFSIAR